MVKRDVISKKSKEKRQKYVLFNYLGYDLQFQKSLP